MIVEIKSSASKIKIKTIAKGYSSYKTISICDYGTSSVVVSLEYCTERE